MGLDIFCVREKILTIKLLVDHILSEDQVTDSDFLLHPQLEEGVCISIIVILCASHVLSSLRWARAQLHKEELFPSTK
jgi:hypothetical protein